MRKFGERRKMLLFGLVMAMTVALPGLAQAGTAEEPTSTTTAEEPPAPPVTEVTSVLPVLGSGLTVSLTRDEAGVITQVALDPAGATVVEESDHKVVFLLADGDTQVVVKSFGSKGKDGDDPKAGGVKTTVTADATTDVTGPGSWSADVFGTGVVTIPYTVSFDGNTPNIEIGEVVAPEGVTAEVGEPKVRSGDEKSKFRISVKLTSGDIRAKVSFLASTRVDDDGQLEVKLAVTLDARDHVRCGWGHDGDHKWERGDRDHDRNDDEQDGNEAAGVSQERWERRGDDDEHDGRRDREQRRDDNDGDRRGGDHGDHDGDDGDGGWG